jgi:hypothetical protein
MYNIAAHFIDGVNKIPIDVVENVIQQSQIPDYLTKEISSL